MDADLGMKDAALVGDKHEKTRDLLEFYFGDSNLLKDRFMRHTIESSEGGWVKISVLLTFPKLRKLTNGDADTIRESAKTSKFLQVSEDGLALSRLAPLPDPSSDDSFHRTIYVEGIGIDCTVEHVHELLQAASVVAHITAEKTRFQGNELKVMSKEEWEASKRAFKAARTQAGTEEKENSKDAAGAHVRSLPGRWQSDHPAFAKGVVLRFVGEGNTPSHTKVKETFEAFAPIRAWDVTALAVVSSPRGKQRFHGHVRFEDCKGARLCLAHMLDRLQRLSGCEIELCLLEGEEEEHYWRMQAQVEKWTPKSQAMSAPSHILPPKLQLGDGRKPSIDTSADTIPEPECGKDYPAGLIIRFKLSEEAGALDYRAIKRSLSAVAPVAFLDYTASKTEGCARMETAEGAAALLSALLSGEKAESDAAKELVKVLGNVVSCERVAGDDEKDVWRTVLQARLVRAKEKACKTLVSPPAAKNPTSTGSQVGGSRASGSSSCANKADKEKKLEKEKKMEKEKKRRRSSTEGVSEDAGGSKSERDVKKSKNTD